MEKLSADETAAIKEAADALVKIAGERDEYAAKCAEYERRETVQKIAQAMFDKGLNEGDLTLSEQTDLLLQKVASGVDVSVLAQAVEWSGRDVAEKIATVADRSEMNSAAALVGFVMGS